ncbi:hypothetical protein JW905_01375 [bacterium]|nr:hypothetical protein [candidate division CSSED10-310 bacterium]
MQHLQSPALGKHFAQDFQEGRKKLKSAGFSFHHAAILAFILSADGILITLDHQAPRIPPVGSVSGDVVLGPRSDAPGLHTEVVVSLYGGNGAVDIMAMHPLRRFLDPCTDPESALVMLPGVGPVIAGNIVEYRNMMKRARRDCEGSEWLLEVFGIGRGKYALLGEYLAHETGGASGSSKPNR